MHIRRFLDLVASKVQFWPENWTTLKSELSGSQTSKVHVKIFHSQKSKNRQFNGTGESTCERRTVLFNKEPSVRYLQFSCYQVESWSRKTPVPLVPGSFGCLVVGPANAIITLVLFLVTVSYAFRSDNKKSERNFQP